MSHTPIKKGMILCAGLGTRLKPVTDKIPKPLVPVLNVENVLHTVRLLERAGIQEIIVNLHYLPEHLEKFLSTHKKIKAKIFFSKESVLLGTGGGVKKAEPFFEGQPFVLANCDFVTNLDVGALIQEHFRTQSLATMFLYQNPRKEPKYSKVGIDSDGHLCQLPKLQTQKPAQTGIFTGIHVIESSCLNILEEKPCGINEILYPTLMKETPDRVRGLFSKSGYWCDTGEVDTFLASTFELLEELKRDPFLKETIATFANEDTAKKQPLVLFGSRCSIEQSAKIGPSAVIGSDTRIGKNCHIANSVVLPNAVVPNDTTITNAIYFESRQIKTP